MPFFQRKSAKAKPAAAPVAPSFPPIPVPPAIPATERRGRQRHPVSPGFPLKVSLGFVGRDDEGRPLSASSHGWHWKGRLVDCSEVGFRVQLGAEVRATVGEDCELRLSLKDFSVHVPCHVTNLRENDEGMVFGLRHDLQDAAALDDYQQLVETLALASSLRSRTHSPKPDESGYFVEHFGGTKPARLTIWRHPEDESVTAFEMQLRDGFMRAAEGHGLEYFTIDERGSRAATAVRCHEMHRHYQWVVMNLPATVADDVKKFLQGFAG